MPSWVKYDEPLTASETYEERYMKPLSKENDIYIESCWEIEKTYAIENLNIPKNTNLLVVSTRHIYSDAITTRLNLKSYCNIDGPINLREYQRVVCQIESLHRITSKCKCNKKCKCSPNPYILVLDEIVSIIAQTQTCLSGLSISLANFSELITQAERVIPQKGKTFCLASDKETVLIELWGWAKQMSSLPFEERKSMTLICHERRNIQEAKRECLPQELLNREIFPNIDTIIRNKDVPTIRLW
ncbi:9835_t:CDS:2, partial [Cetraspora pellucida]